MSKNHLFALITATTVLMAGISYAASYTYKCLKCGYTATYDRPAMMPRCPSDGSSMILSQ